MSGFFSSRLCIQSIDIRYERSVANSPRFGCYLQVPTGPCWGLLMPTVISVSTWLPSLACYLPANCLDRRCVHKSLVTSEYDRIISSASITHYMHTCLLRATIHAHAQSTVQRYNLNMTCWIGPDHDAPPALTYSRFDQSLERLYP